MLRQDIFHSSLVTSLHKKYNENKSAPLSYTDSKGNEVKVKTPKTEAEMQILQSKQRIYVLDKSYAIMPDVNKNYIRFYGHYMCPFVEKVRLVLYAKNIPFQDCQINLEKRTKWHYEINGGLVPILELPSGEIITESQVIMDFLDKITGNEKWASNSDLKGKIRPISLYS